MNGLCTRTHLEYSDNQSLVNLLAEPFSPSDIMRSSKVTTQALNDAVFSFEGVEVRVSDGIFVNDTSYILTVSSAVIAFLGNVGAFFSPNINVIPEMKLVPNFNFYNSDMQGHCGGMFKGTPLKFNTLFDVKIFIKNLLAGCGFRTILPPDGYKNDGVVRKQMQTPSGTGGANAHITPETNESKEIESTRFITADDIFNLYVLPTKFCVNILGDMIVAEKAIVTMPTLATFHGLRAEDNSKSKFLTYPYCYTKVITANGDSMNIIPQSHHKRNGSWGNDSSLILDLVFIGGDTPKLLGRFCPAFSDTAPNSNGHLGEWFVIRNYPSLPLFINNSFNPQLQKEFQQAKTVSAMYINSVQSSEISSPFKQGYIEGVEGKNFENSNGSFLGNILGNVGNALGKLANPETQPLSFKNENRQNAQNANRSMNAGNTVSPQTCSVSGNDFGFQLGIPAFTAYFCGASNAENFSFCRYVEVFGQACNCIINPLTNAGDIWGGLASVGSFQGYTFYQYSYINIIGDCPIPWKNSIKALFESGVYLF